MLLNFNSVGGNIMKKYFQNPSIQILLCVQLRICHVYRNKKNIHNSVNWHTIKVENTFMNNVDYWWLK